MNSDNHLKSLSLFLDNFLKTTKKEDLNYILEKIGVSKATIYCWKNSYREKKRFPTIDKLLILSEEINVGIETMLSLESNNEEIRHLRKDRDDYKEKYELARKIINLETIEKEVKKIEKS